MTPRSMITWRSASNYKDITISTHAKDIEGELVITVGEGSVTIPYRDIDKLVKSMKHILTVLEFPQEEY
jgi:hypothetical protein